VFQPWIADAALLGEAFRSARPFPHLVIDDFLDRDAAAAVVAEFPDIGAMPKSRDYIFADKHELSSLARQGPASSALATALLGQEFQEFVSTVTGRALFIDPSFFGGGFHQGGDGSFLDMHVDFNIHPEHRDWLRVLNVLLYLNPDWSPDYGGELLIKSDPDEDALAIAPVFNRAVIMLTAENTFHGYRRMTLPPNVTRRSVAAYAYQLVVPGDVASRTTGWRPDDASAARRLIARHYSRVVVAKTRLFGSRTAKNR
jgi:2OG-Fe(II) oxygenase superfamily